MNAHRILSWLVDVSVLFIAAVHVLIYQINVFLTEDRPDVLPDFGVLILTIIGVLLVALRLVAHTKRLLSYWPY